MSKAHPIELSFHGGAGTVTGSRHLLTTPTCRMLVDVGLFQGLKELRELNWRKPAFDPRSVDHLLLTHTHIDHAGYLPRLVREGYRGPVHCTPATAELAHLLLLDSAKIQEEDAAFANKKGFSKHRPALPLYTTEDAERALRRLQPVDYGVWLSLGEGVRARYLNAGHILGSAHIEVQIAQTRSAGGGGSANGLSVLFSGDVGRYDMPLHVDPLAPPACDVLVVESTYGDRRHDSAPFSEQIRRPFQETLQHGGVVLIPSFAVGRAQQVTLILTDMVRSGQLPEVPIHIDSPMAVDATRIYASHLSDRNLDAGLGVDAQGRPGGSRLFPRNVVFHRSVDESKALNQLRGPRVILSSSGMLTGGRILHHLAQRLPDPRNLVVLVGYQAAGTRGRALEQGARSLRLHGMDVPVRARTLSVHGLSGHADQDELLRWIRSGPRPPARAFVTHGEPEAAHAFAERLRRDLNIAAETPRLGQSFALA
jgi:metallo-beta-lactamase family protein